MFVYVNDSRYGTLHTITRTFYPCTLYGTVLCCYGNSPWCVARHGWADCNQRAATFGECDGCPPVCAYVGVVCGWVVCVWVGSVCVCLCVLICIVCVCVCMCMHVCVCVCVWVGGVCVLIVGGVCRCGGE